MRTLAAAILLLAAAGNGWPQAAKPKCNKAVQGRFWPEAANDDRQAARASAQRGELEICTIGRWRYTWTPLTVRVSALKGTAPSTDSSNSAPILATEPRNVNRMH